MQFVLRAKYIDIVYFDKTIEGCKVSTINSLIHYLCHIKTKYFATSWTLFMDGYTILGLE